MAKFKEPVIKLPRNEVGRVEIMNPKTNMVDMVITENSKTGRFSIFKIKGTEVEKLGSANSPIDLENKYIKRKGS